MCGLVPVPALILQLQPVQPLLPPLLPLLPLRGPAARHGLDQRTEGERTDLNSPRHWQLLTLLGVQETSCRGEQDLLLLPLR